jgi:hypothetical protein
LIFHTVPDTRRLTFILFYSGFAASFFAAAGLARGALGAVPAAAVFVLDTVTDCQKKQNGYNSQNDKIRDIHKNLLLV